MPIEKNSEETISNDTEACYEAVASQEEIYLEEVEEELRATLIFDGPSKVAESAVQGSSLCES